MDSIKVEEQLDLAAYYASRSGIRSYQTGAVILSKRGAPLSNGWSHFSEGLQLRHYRSIHAELHAIIRTPFRALLDGASIFVTTIRGKSGARTLSKPCDFCYALCREVGIAQVYYTTSGEWASIAI